MPEKSAYRASVLQKIKEYEKNGWFDRDVEDDPPTVPLDADKIDYTYSGAGQKIKTRIANLVARTYFDNLIKKKQLIIKEVVGLENFTSVKTGALITCNHFNPFDNYAVYKAIQKPMEAWGRDLYKIIREGNYTSFKGIYGYFFRNCNTLPLASSMKAMKKMMSGVDTLLKRGEKILIYPEQGMWWNYRKPRPLKDGAFHFAVRSGVPVIPFFIAMEDTDIIDGEGYPVQAYTIYIMPAVYPDCAKTPRENEKYMKDAVYGLMKDKYERFYGVPLSYSEGAEGQL